MARTYRMGKRAESLEAVRNAILKATMIVHDRVGVAPATYADIAAEAGVGVATIYRHFPQMGDLVRTCGMHVWQQMQPPTAESATGVFAGIDAVPDRVAKLVDELNAFYDRGELRLRLASRDRELLPELHGFLSAVEGGVEALIREGLKDSGAGEDAISLTIAQLSFPAWQALRRTGLPEQRLREHTIQLVLANIDRNAGRNSRKRLAPRRTQKAGVVRTAPAQHPR